jgi:hypothetical protein
MGRYYEITGLGTVTSVLEASSIQRCGVPDGTRPGALLVRAYLLFHAYATLRFRSHGRWSVKSVGST